MNSTSGQLGSHNGGPVHELAAACDTGSDGRRVSNRRNRPVNLRRHGNQYQLRGWVDWTNRILYLAKTTFTLSGEAKPQYICPYFMIKKNWYIFRTLVAAFE
jgi:hypothetical protein